MEDTIQIQGADAKAVWPELKKHITAEPSLLRYKARITQGKWPILVFIDIDLGGGFQSGISTTSISARLSKDPGFRFAIHRERIIDELGKLLGMQDVEIGFDAFDEKMIIKTDNEQRTHDTFADRTTRKTFNTLSNFSFHTDKVSNDEGETHYLEFSIDEGLVDPVKLRAIYMAFSDVLEKIDA